jgi:hypothetical protein
MRKHVTMFEDFLSDEVDRKPNDNNFWVSNVSLQRRMNASKPATQSSDVLFPLEFRFSELL